MLSRLGEWLAALLGTILFAVAWAAVPTFVPIFESFGRDLPLPTRLWLAGRPVYLLLCAASALCIALLLVFPALRVPAGRRRWLRACFAFLAAFVLGTLWALFAPQFMGTLAGG
jgi:type II secretory pathway component PulF